MYNTESAMSCAECLFINSVTVLVNLISVWCVECGRGYLRLDDDDTAHTERRE